MLLRAVALSLLALLAACGGEAPGQPAEEQTYFCGSYEPLGEGVTATEPPC